MVEILCRENLGAMRENNFGGDLEKRDDWTLSMFKCPDLTIWGMSLSGEGVGDPAVGNSPAERGLTGPYGLEVWGGK